MTQLDLLFVLALGASAATAALFSAIAMTRQQERHVTVRIDGQRQRR